MGGRGTPNQRCRRQWPIDPGRSHDAEIEISLSRNAIVKI
jgi:hypothetical protein